MWPRASVLEPRPALASNRRTHFVAVCRLTPVIAAACAIGQPLEFDPFDQGDCLPSTVNFALRWDIVRALRKVLRASTPNPSTGRALTCQQRLHQSHLAGTGRGVG